MYARLAIPLIREDLDISAISILRHCDEQSVRSLNGCRVTYTILKEVRAWGVENWREALLFCVRRNLRWVSCWKRNAGACGDAPAAQLCPWDT